MVQYSINEVKEGMVLGRSIYLPRGDLLLAAGYKIKQSYIQKLKSMGFHYVYVNEKGTEDIIPEDIIAEQVMREAEVAVGKSYKGLEDLEIVKRAMQDNFRSFEREIEKNKDKFKEIIVPPAVKETLTQIIDKIIENPNVVLNLSSLKSVDDYLYQHAINVTIMSLSLAKIFNFTREEMEDLAMGAICFDIGMIAVPKEIVRKRGDLSEEEFNVMREHTTYGHLMLSQVGTLPPTSSVIALQHHERQDGSGYPIGLRGDNGSPYKDIKTSGKIHRYAEIVAVADCYDAIVSARPYASPSVPGMQAVAKLIRAAGTHLNSTIVKKFISIIPLYPVGCRFIIKDHSDKKLIGGKGVVSKQNTTNLNQPQLLLLTDHASHTLESPRIIEMERYPDLKIELLF